MVDIGGVLVELRNAARRAHPAAAPARPVRRDDRLLPVGELPCEAAVGSEDEARAVEGEFVLPADAVEEGERQAGFDDAADRRAEPPVVLADLIGRAVRDDKNFGAGLGEAFGDVGEPDVFADRYAETNIAKRQRAGQRARVEDALLVEGAVVGQQMLARDRRDASAVEQRGDIEQLAVLCERQADEQRRAAVAGRRREPRQFEGARGDERGA